MDDRAINSTARPRFLMCRPQYYAVSYSINPWMDPQGWASAGADLWKAADQQWAAFHDMLFDKGASIEFVDPKPGLPDLVFTANAAIVLDGKALLSRFRHPERMREEPIFAAAFHTLREQAQIYSVEELPADMILEGAGDCIWDEQRGQFWMGYGPRSDRAASHVVADYFGAECVALELADPCFYHLDTAFCALPSGDVIYYPGAFTASARHAIEERVGPSQRITLDPAEAAQFSANAVSFDHCLVVSSCTDALRRKVEERGFTALTTPLHAFLRSGGSACCLTLRLDQDRKSPIRQSKGAATNRSSRGTITYTDDMASEHRPSGQGELGR